MPTNRRSQNLPTVSHDRRNKPSRRVREEPEEPETAPREPARRPRFSKEVVEKEEKPQRQNIAEELLAVTRAQLGINDAATAGAANARGSEAIERRAEAGRGCDIAAVASSVQHKGFLGARAARESHVVEAARVERLAEARARVLARKNQKEEEWEGEVTQFGEEEANRRRLDEFTCSKEGSLSPKPNTSEVDDADLMEKIYDPSIYASAALRIGTRLVWSHNLGIFLSADGFSVSHFKSQLHAELDKKDPQQKGWEVTNLMVSIRARRNRGKWVKRSINELSDTAWETINKVIRSEAAKYAATAVDLKIEVQAVINKEKKTSSKRIHRDLSSDPAVPSSPDRKRTGRVTRTDVLLDRQEERASTLREAGNFDRKLLHRWQCKDRVCTNINGWYFVDFTTIWIIRNSANGVRQLPTVKQESSQSKDLYIYEEFEKGGPVVYNSKRSNITVERQEAQVEREEAKDFMSRYMKFNEQQLELRLAETIAKSVRKMATRQRPPPQQQQQTFSPLL